MAARRYTRQLATIVAIDAVGFSRLMGVDDEAALAAFEERRDAIVERCNAHGGRTFGDAGDSIMAEFGTPAAALLAAFDFQERIGVLDAAAPADGRMPFRAGINTGDVIAHEGRLYGEDVNIAARIQEFAPHGGLAISETTWHHVKEKIAAEFDDLGVLSLKNIALPVRVFSVGRARKSERTQPQNLPLGVHGRTASPGPPAIAVLPFGSGSAADLAYLADGMAEEIGRGLSNVRWLSVIAMASSSQFRDDALDTRLVGSALGARYVVRGTIARQGDDIRLSISLTDASNGRLVWSRRFDRALDDIFALQTEIGIEIVSTLEKEVDRIEQVRTFQVPWESLETWQLVLRGRWHMARRTSQDTELAFDIFTRAFAEDPNSSAVLNALSWWWFWRAWLRFGDSADLDRVAFYAHRALLMDSQDARPHAHLGATEIMRGRPARAAEHLETALHFNPSFAFARSAMGSARLLLNQPAAAIPFLRDAERLSPFDIYSFHNLGELAAAYSLVGDWTSALETAERSLALSPGYFYARLLRIGALIRCGRLEEARREREIFDTRHPDFTVQRVKWIPFVDRAANDLLIANFNESGKEQGP
jgi:TolB-like protein/class 3 adenylate cyclase